MLERIIATLHVAGMNIKTKLKDRYDVRDDTGGVLEWVVISVAGLTLALLIYAALNSTISNWISDLSQKF